MLWTVMERQSACKNGMRNVIRDMTVLRKNEKGILEIKGYARKRRENKQKERNVENNTGQ